MRNTEVPLLEYRALYLGLMLLAALAGYLWATRNVLPPPERASGVRDMQGGTYVRMVFIGSSACSYCNDETHALVREAKDSLRKITAGLGLGFLSTGISVDMNGDMGKRYLEKTGPYDEIIAGVSWYNLGIDRYNWTDFYHPASTPQVLVTRVIFDVSAGSAGIQSIARDEVLLKRFVGFEGVEELAALGRNRTNMEALLIE